MKEIRVNKAQPVGTRYVEPALIVIDVEIENMPTVERWRRETETQDIYLANVLSSTLPEATLDAMLVELLNRKRSMLAVPSVVE